MPRKKTNKPCRCGCGGVSVSGDFMRGHEAIHVRNLLIQVGSWDALEHAVELYKLAQKMTDEKTNS